MKTILVPTDFSKRAINASEYAVNLAKDIEASVLLLHVYNAPVMISPDAPILMPMPQELQQESENRLKMQLEDLRKKAPGVEMNFKAVMGLPVEEIRELGKNADFIVMGMRGAGKLDELLGSVSTATIKKVSTPVFIIPEHVTYRKFEKAVLATDYSIKTNVNSFEPLKKLVSLFNLKVFIVNIKIKEEIPLMEKMIAEERVESKFADVDHLYYFPESDDFVKGINDFIKDKQADVLAIIPHRYNWIEGLFHKSSSKKMAFHAKVPILALPDKA